MAREIIHHAWLPADARTLWTVPLETLDRDMSASIYQESERLMGAIRTGRDAAITAKAEMESQLEAANGKLLEAKERFLKAEDQSYSPESEWVRANHREGGDVDLFSQSGWTELLKGLPLNERDILTFQYEGDVILTVTTPHSMTGYEKVGSDGLLAV
ncbi:hypothetical protein NE237_006804 [Protea cynaroides]|uniref:Uncharacterized protein n=1 Tax=Protea cynaroides TaxID=273540 RepID=A0A9Q0QVI5_9MAGN|nr:hypothetical protein NE237_006804 [Protea cynaroides]